MRKIVLFVLALFSLASFLSAIFAQDYYNITSGSTQFIDKWTPSKTVTNNCPRTIYVPVNTSAEWNSFVSNPPSCVNLASAVCGDGFCDADENATDCPGDCDPYIWPYSSNVASCADSAGIPHSSTGKDSLTWFYYGGCPAWKTYNVTPNEPVVLYAFTDDCAPCVCYHMNFCLSEFVEGVWKQIICFNWGDTKGLSKAQQFTPYENETYSSDPSENKIMITGQPGDCFYFELHRTIKTR
jgi:hypothetical protein